MAWAFQGDGEDSEKEKIDLKLSKLFWWQFKRTHLRGTRNLHLGLVQVEQDNEDDDIVEPELDDSLWSELLHPLKLKILLQHLPMQKVFDMLENHPVLMDQLLHSSLSSRCAITLQKQESTKICILHNFGSSSMCVSRFSPELNPEHFPVRPIALSPQGILLLCTADGFLCCCNLPAKSCRLVNLPSSEITDLNITAAQVVHADEEDGCKLVLAFDTKMMGETKCFACKVPESGAIRWAELGAQGVRYRGFADTEISASAHGFAGGVILPSGFCCSGTTPYVVTRDSSILFAIAKDEENRVVLFAVKNDNETLNWDLIPGPPTEITTNLVLNHLRALGTDEQSVTFIDSENRMATCLVNSWEWCLSINIKCWKHEGCLIHALF